MPEAVWSSWAMAAARSAWSRFARREMRRRKQKASWAFHAARVVRLSDRRTQRALRHRQPLGPACVHQGADTLPLFPPFPSPRLGWQSDEPRRGFGDLVRGQLKPACARAQQGLRAGQRLPHHTTRSCSVLSAAYVCVYTHTSAGATYASQCV